MVRNLLIIECHPDFRHLIASCASAAGCAALLVESADEALDALATQAPPALILADVASLGYAVEAFIPEIKRQWPTVPLILLATELEVRAQARRLGAAGAIVKGERGLHEQIMATIAKHLGKSPSA